MTLKQLLIQLEEYVMSLYETKASTLTALKITAIDGEVITFDDGTTYTTNAPVLSVNIGDYSVLLPSGNVTFIPSSFFEAEFTPLLTFTQAITALVSGSAIKRVGGTVIYHATDAIFTFENVDIIAADWEVVAS